jgi:hypothetical protein
MPRTASSTRLARRATGLGMAGAYHAGASALHEAGVKTIPLVAVRCQVFTPSTAARLGDERPCVHRQQPAYAGGFR